MGTVNCHADFKLKNQFTSQKSTYYTCQGKHVEQGLILFIWK